MKTYLLYPDKDLDLSAPNCWNADDLVQDLALETLFHAMGERDKYLIEIAQKVILGAGVLEPSEILYRQDVLKDCMEHAGTVKELYELAVDAIECPKTIYLGFFFRYPDAVLRHGIDLLHLLVVRMKKLKAIADAQGGRFRSAGFRRMLASVQAELDPEYIASIERHLERLEFRDGLLMSARLGEGNRGEEYILRSVSPKKKTWLQKLFGEKPSRYSFEISDRDESGARILSQLKDFGRNGVANAVAQSTDHILSFFSQLRAELGFYLGCLNLRDQLALLNEPTCFPDPVRQQDRKHAVKGLYDPSLALRLRQRVVGNDLAGDGRQTVIITGANQGGKSTFLRSIGIAQLMMECGMFVPAESFCANVSSGIITHHSREEDASMNSGKFDEELQRMSLAVDHMRSNALVLFNESFAATNEREGSETARQIVQALMDRCIKVFFVTHLYEFASGFFRCNNPGVLFLRAERDNDGQRSYKIAEGEPGMTSYGEDLYDQIFSVEKGKALQGGGTLH